MDENLYFKNRAHAPSGIHIQMNIDSVFSSLKSLMLYLQDKKEYWEPNYEDDNIINKSYYDLETFYTSNGDKKLFYLLYKNNLGYFNNPEVFKNQYAAKRSEIENTKMGKSCKKIRFTMQTKWEKYHRLQLLLR